MLGGDTQKSPPKTRNGYSYVSIIKHCHPKLGFAGFAIKTFGFNTVSLGGTDALGRSSLVIKTVDAEPVPEPTTIFGSVLALSLGGWLKRQKLS
jgi:hypothetical protein